MSECLLVDPQEYLELQKAKADYDKFKALFKLFCRDENERFDIDELYTFRLIASFLEDKESEERINERLEILKKEKFNI